MKEPTETGKEKYPPDGIYDETLPCTCNPKCPCNCKGEKCGCRACSAAYFDAIFYD